MTREYVIGVDMGGTNLRCAAVSRGGRILLMQASPANASDSAARVADNIVAGVFSLEKSARRFGKPIAIGVAVPGPLNVTTGVVYAAPHVKAWRSFPLRRRLQSALGRRVIVENDANAWALGEFWRGAARGRRNVVLLTLGTGVGGALIVDGRLVHGRTGMAAELGHVTVEPDGMRCDCGASGCLEAYASASGMRGLLAKELTARPIPSRYLDRQGNFSVRRMTVSARSGDARAKRIFAVAGRYLGIAIGSFINIFNPEMIVIGGGVGGALWLMRSEMMREVRGRAFKDAVAQTRIVRAALGGGAGAIGAAKAALDAVEIET